MSKKIIDVIREARNPATTDLGATAVSSSVKKAKSLLEVVREQHAAHAATAKASSVSVATKASSKLKTLNEPELVAIVEQAARKAATEALGAVERRRSANATTTTRIARKGTALAKSGEFVLTPIRRQK